MNIEIMTNILEKNDQIAESINNDLTKRRIFTINLLGSPGSGKTTLLEKTIMALKEQLRMAVIEGDLFTAKDAQRIAKLGVQVVQINTGGGCHLDANMIKNVLAKIDLNELDLLIIENVGNLVCPAEFYLGEDAKITILSVTEGEDKPLKYPLMFKQSQVALLNKIDLLPHVTFNMDAAAKDIAALNPAIEILPVSCYTQDGMQLWYDWLNLQVAKKKGD